MKPATVTLVCLICLLAGPAHAGLLTWWFGEPWSFIESVGGIRVAGAQRNEDGGVTLDLDCDVSGLRTITTPPTVVNSALGVRRVDVERRDSILIVSIHVTVQATSTCPHPTVRSLPPGEYAVVYRGADRDVHPIGSVAVP
jgi:hypothetical protein